MALPRVANRLVQSTPAPNETYYRGKRDLLQRQKRTNIKVRQKRPTIEAQETYYRGKRAKREVKSTPAPNETYYEAKETYYRGKREVKSTPSPNSIHHKPRVFIIFVVSW
jgi:hypothetical protein